MIEGLTYLSSHSQADIQSIGLVFESNFFTAYFYGDLDAQKLVAYKVSNSIDLFNSEELKNLKPVYAISFKGEYTLVPQQVFNEGDAGKYLIFNTSADSENADWDRIIGLESVVVYQSDKKAEKAVDSLFPGLRLKHGMGALLEFCRRNKSDGIHAFLHQSHNIFDFVIFNKSGLLFANSIDASHAEDVRYFVLYTLKTLELPTNISVNLLGAAAKNDKVINLLKPYLPKLATTLQNLNVTSKINFQSISTPQFTATNWAGIYASLCV